MPRQKSIAEKLINRAMHRYEMCLVPVIYWRVGKEGSYHVNAYKKYTNNTCRFSTYPQGYLTMDQAVLHAYKYMINNNWEY